MAWHLKLIAPGVAAETIHDALKLAEAAFDKAGVTPEQTVLGAFEREAWDISGFADDKVPSDEQYTAAAVLDARAAVMRHCYGDAIPPDGAT